MEEMDFKHRSRCIRMAQDMVSPYLREVNEGSSDEIKEMVTKLIMALGLATVVLGKTFLPETDAKKFAGHIADYIEETMESTSFDLKKGITIGKRGDDHGRKPEQRGPKESLWG